MTDTRPAAPTDVEPAPVPVPEHPELARRDGGGDGGGHDADDRGQVPGGWRLALAVAAVASVGLLTRASILVVILALVVMIFFHELGHYLTAKWSGMKVTEFFIGFGPKIWSFHRGETEYGLKAIPAGAYVRIIGMSNLEEVPVEDERRTYRQQSYPKRMLVVLAGSGMHFLMAVACIFALLVAGVPGGTLFDLDRRAAADEAVRAGSWSVGDVTEGSAADVAGLLPGDRVVGIAGEPVDGWADVPGLIQPRGGETVAIEVVRDGQALTLTTELGERDGSGFLGVAAHFEGDAAAPLGPVEAAYRSVVEAGMGMRASTEALVNFFTGGIGDMASQVANGGRVDSPAIDPADPPSGGRVVAEEGDGRLLSIVGATRLGADLTEGGWQGLVFFMVLINLFIGLFNLLPLLPLDGGHAAVATYERLRSRRGRRYMVDSSRLVPVTYTVFLALVVLGLSALYLDIVAPISIR